MLIRRNDRHQQAVTGDAVLNGYRGVVTAVTAHGVEVEWRDPAGDTDAPPSRALLSAGYIAQGGLELGYALTAHKAEGLTVGGTWQRPDGSTNHGSVLVYAPGMDNPGLYVSLSRDKGQTVLFGARAELEGDRENLIYGPPRNQTGLTDRVIAALAQQAAATAETANDRPVLVDLGQTPANPGVTPQPAQPEPAPASLLARPRAPRPASAPAPDRQRTPERERTAQREPIGAGLTEEQRTRLGLLRLREEAARLVGDHDAVRVLEAEQRALLGPSGPQPTRRQPTDPADRADRAAARERWRAQWLARPHSRLIDKELTQAIGQAEQRQTRQRAAAEQARREIAKREPAVAAGRGPEVARLDAERGRLRHRAEVQSRAEDVQRHRRAVVERAKDAAELAVQCSIDAQRTRRWQTGKRERLQTEAAEHRAEQERAHDEAKELARQMAEHLQELGGPKIWQLAREQAEQADARYPEDRLEAQREDEAALTRAREHVARLDRNVAQVGTHREELIAEQQLRQAMPQVQRMAEGLWRIEAHQQEIRALEHQAAENEPEPDLAPYQPEWELDYHERTVDRGLDIDRGGPGLGM